MKSFRRRIVECAGPANDVGDTPVHLECGHVGHVLRCEGAPDAIDCHDCWQIDYTHRHGVCADLHIVGAASCFAVTPIRPVVVLETWLAPDE
jgi:hypothetical protein